MVRILDRFGGLIEDHPDATRQDVRRLLEPWMNEGDVLSFVDDQDPAIVEILAGGTWEPLDIYAEIPSGVTGFIMGGG